MLQTSYFMSWPETVLALIALFQGVLHNAIFGMQPRLFSAQTFPQNTLLTHSHAKSCSKHLHALFVACCSQKQGQDHNVRCKAKGNAECSPTISLQKLCKQLTLLSQNMSDSLQKAHFKQGMAAAHLGMIRGYRRHCRNNYFSTQKGKMRGSGKYSLKISSAWIRATVTCLRRGESM